MEELKLKNGKIKQYIGYRYCIVRFAINERFKLLNKTKHEWGCAYVEIPESMYKYLQSKYEEFPVHGGISYYSDNFNNISEGIGTPAKDEYVVIGWDYGHLEDTVNHTDREIKNDIQKFIRWASDECTE